MSKAKSPHRTPAASYHAAGAGLVGAPFGFVIAQSGGLDVTLVGPDRFDVRLFGRLAWTGTGHPRWPHGLLLMGFMFVGMFWSADPDARKEAILLARGVRTD